VAEADGFAEREADAEGLGVVVSAVDMAIVGSSEPDAAGF
jgi:hypothetical protein